MTKKITSEKNTAFHFIQEVMREVTMIKPTTQEMLRDIKMMDFKVRPVMGDLFALAHKQTGLLEQLWRIGKIEDIVRRAITTLDGNERGLFFNYIDNLEREMQERASKELHELPLQDGEKQRLVTLEIFKEAHKRKKVN